MSMAWDDTEVLLLDELRRDFRGELIAIILHDS
jgi:hypothetical protein